MKPLHTIKDIENNIYLKYQQDGILETLVGILIIGFAFGIHFDLYYIGTIFFLFGVPVFYGLKKKFTLPKLGYIKFSSTRQNKIKMEKSVFSIFFSLILISGIIIYFYFTKDNRFEPFLRKFILLPFGIIGLICFSLIAYFKKLIRFIFYALVLLLSTIIGPILNLPVPLYFSIAGAIITISGLIYLIIFIKKYSSYIGGQ